MNDFEQNVQSKRNDAIDSGVGFIVSFGFSQHFSSLQLLLNLSVLKDCCLLAVFLSIPCFIICDFATKRSAFLFKNIGNSTLLIRAPYFNPNLLKTLYNFLMRVPIPIPFTDRNNRYVRLYGAQKAL